MPSIISSTATHKSFLQIEAEYDKKHIVGEFADGILGTQMVCIIQLSNYPRGPCGLSLTLTFSGRLSMHNVLPHFWIIHHRHEYWL